MWGSGVFHAHLHPYVHPQQQMLWTSPEGKVLAVWGICNRNQILVQARWYLAQMRFDYIINLDSYTWFCVHVIWILDEKARRWVMEMICFLGKSRQKGAFLTEQNFHRLWDKSAGFYPADGSLSLQKSWTRATHHTPHTQQRSSAHAWAPRPLRGTESSVTVKHMLVLLTNRNGFNYTNDGQRHGLSTFSSNMPSPNRTYPPEHSRGCGTLSSILSSLASVSFSFSLPLLLCTPLYTPLHPIVVLVRGTPGCGPAPGVMHPMGWVLWERALTSLRLCELSQGPASSETCSISSSREGCDYACIKDLAD